MSDSRVAGFGGGLEAGFVAELEGCWPARAEAIVNSARVANVVRVFIVLIAFRVGRALLPAYVFSEPAIRSVRSPMSGYYTF